MPLFLQWFQMKPRPNLFQLPQWGDLGWTPTYIAWRGNVPREGILQNPQRRLHNRRMKKIVWNSDLHPSERHEEMQWHHVSTSFMLYMTWPVLGEVWSLAWSPLTCTSKLSQTDCCESRLLQNKTLIRLWAPNVVIHPTSSHNTIARTGWTHTEILDTTCHWPDTTQVNAASLRNAFQIL